MATTKYSYLRMEPADNGVIISWDEQTKTGTGKYDNTEYKSKKEVFDFDSDDKEDGLEKAFARFKELWKLCHMGDKSETKALKESY